MIKPKQPDPSQSPANILLAVARATAIKYRRSQVMGLLMIAGVILLVALWRADLHSLFAPGWWR